MSHSLAVFAMSWLPPPPARLVGLLLALSACVQAAPEPPVTAAAPSTPVAPHAAAPDEQPVDTQPATGASARAPAETPETGPNGTDLSRLDAASRACLSERILEFNPGHTFYEISRGRDSLGEYVHIAVAMPGQTLDSGFSQSLLLFQTNGPCLSMLDYDGMVYSLEEGTSSESRGEVMAAFERWKRAWDRGEIR